MNKFPRLAYKVGASSYLFEGEKKTLSAPPLIKDEKILLPTDSLPEGLKGSKTLVGGVSYTDADTLGCYVKYDSMGLIALDPEPWVTELSRKGDLNYMLELMGEFLYDVEKVRFSGYGPASAEERAAFRRIGEELRRKLCSHARSHPYIYADENKFARLCKLYEEKDATLIPAIEKMVKRAENVVAEERYALREDMSALVTPLTNPHADGYDEGGRLGDTNTHAGNMRLLAFAYRLTGKELFAILAYRIGECICKWEHWGPGHFLNCAGTVQDVAICYDWLYNAWRELKLDTGVIRRGIFELGLKDGFDSAIHDRCDHPSPRQGTGWRFKAKPDNWNAVCNCGLLIAALAFLFKDADGSTEQSMIEDATELLGLNLSSLTQPTLVLKQYAPDGSYVESNSYWAYGTSNLFRGIGAIHSALGTDLGISHAPGLDKTCYYAINSESSEFVGWNYHDGSLSSQDTSCFNLFATVSGDSMLYAIRADQVKRGKSMTEFDLLYHPVVLGVETPSLSDLPLDYYMEGIDALTVRDGWERGSLYAGIMGGYNPGGGSHNQIDSGAFIYHNKGVLWLTDLGSDNYNIKGGYFGNYKLYRRVGEGANNLCLKSLPCGQMLDATGKITDVRTGGAPYAVIDQRPIYDEEKTVEARRGMLLSNNRKTLVIQDEARFSSPEDLFWIAHYPSKDITAELSEGGRVATLTHKDGEKIKLTVLGIEAGFEIISCYDYLLDCTADFEGEHSREGYRRLVIKMENVTDLNLAVAIECPEDSGYTEIIPTAEWRNI